MKKMRFAFPLAVVLILLGMPRAASAKSPTAKITISGGGLTSAIEITDPRILEKSNVWGGNFLDSSRIPVKEPPLGLRTYEVSFYLKSAHNNVRKAYVVYYSPHASTEQGYIYLPGKGEPWYYLNVGSNWSGQEGRWNRASRAWEDLIKQVIARAEAAQHHGS